MRASYRAGDRLEEAKSYTHAAPNKGVELTAYSVRSCLAPASSRSSRLALGVLSTDYSGDTVRNGEEHYYSQLLGKSREAC
jgi:hypothetical protein